MAIRAYLICFFLCMTSSSVGCLHYVYFYLFGVCLCCSKRFHFCLFFAFFVPSVFRLLMSDTRNSVREYVATPYAMSGREVVGIQV